MCVPVCAGVHTRARGRHQISSSAILHLIFLRQGLSLYLELTGLEGRLTSKLQGTAHLHFPSAEVAASPGFYMDTKDLNSGLQACTASTNLFSKVQICFMLFVKLDYQEGLLRLSR